MAKFKEVMKAIIEKPKEVIKKVAKNEAVTKVAIPVTTAAVSTTVAVKRLHDTKKQHEEDLREYKKLAEKIDDLSKKVDEKEKEPKKEKRSIFKRKRFSIEGGGFRQPSPRSVMAEGLKKIAEESKFRSLETSDQSLIKAVRNTGDENCTIGNRPENTSARMSAYQKGDVVVFMIRYLGCSDSDKLSHILDSYCRTFRNADYSSEVSSDGSGFVELWVAENSLDFLVKQLVTNGFSLNVVL